MHKKNSFLILVICLSFGSSQAMFRPLAQKVLNAAKNILLVKYNNNLAKKTIAGSAVAALSAYGVHSLHSHKRNLTTESINKEEEIASRLIDEANKHNRFFAHNEIYPWTTTFFSLSPEKRNMIRQKLPNPWTPKEGYEKTISHALKNSPQLKQALDEERKILNKHGLSWYIPHEMPAFEIKNSVFNFEHNNSDIDELIEPFTPVYYDTPVSVKLGKYNYQGDGMKIKIGIETADLYLAKAFLACAQAKNELRQPVTESILYGSKFNNPSAPNDYSKDSSEFYNNLSNLSRVHAKQSHLLGGHIAGKESCLRYIEFVESIAHKEPGADNVIDYMCDEIPLISKYS